MWERNGEEFYFDEPENETIWMSIVNLMDDATRELVHMECAPCSNRYFIERYIEIDREFEQVLAEEFGIERFQRWKRRLIAMKKDIKLTSPAKKEDILKAIVELFEEANVGYDNHPGDRYYLGRHAALYDLLQKVKIYEKEEK